MRIRSLALLCLLALAQACGDGDGPRPDGALPGDATPGSDGGPGADGGPADAGPRPDGESACPAAELGAALGGRDRLLVEGSMSDAAFAGAPFDLRYRYVAGAVPAGGPCTSCATGCTVNGQSCDNANGCEWWSCWQWDQEPPGRFVARFAENARAAGAIPMITYYIWYSVAGYVEGGPEIAALQDGDRVADLLADFRFLCEVLAETLWGRTLVV